MFFGSDDTSAKVISNTFPEIRGHVINFYSDDDLYAGPINVGSHSVDGIISEGEYDAKIENISITDKNYAFSRNQMAKNVDAQNVSFYLDYDEENIYFAAKTLDSARNPSRNIGTGFCRVMVLLATAPYESASKPGSIGFELKKSATGSSGTLFARMHYDTKKVNDAGFKDIRKNVKYTETQNADGSVNEIFEVVIPRALFKEVAGVDVGEELYFRAAVDFDDAAESVTDRFVIGVSNNHKSAFSLVNDQYDYWSANAAKCFTVHLSGKTEAKNFTEEDGKFYVGNNNGTVTVDGKVDSNDNYLLAIEGLNPVDQNSPYYSLLEWPAGNSTTVIDTKNVNLYISKDEANVYFATVNVDSATSSETTTRNNVFTNFYVTRKGSSNWMEIRFFINPAQNSYFKVAPLTRDFNDSDVKTWTMKTSTVAGADNTIITTFESAIPLSDFKAYLGLGADEDLDEFEFNSLIFFDNAAGGIERIFFTGPAAAINDSSVLSYGWTANRSMFSVKMEDEPAVQSCVHAYELSDNADGHFEKCVVCGVTKSLVSHSYGDIVALDSYRHGRICTVCGYEADAVAHSFAAYTSCNDSVHSMVCSCGYKEKVSEHILPTANAAFSATHTGKKEIACTANGCDYVLREKYLVEDGCLLKEYGQKWYFSGTLPSSNIGKPSISVDGKISDGEYNTFDGNVYFAQADSAYLALGINADQDNLYFAIEALNEKEDETSNGNVDTEVYIHLYPANEGGAQTYDGTEDWIELRASYLNGEFFFSAYKNGTVDNSYVIDAAGSIGGGYRLNTNEYDSLTFELVIDRAAILEYAKSFVDSKTEVVDKLYIRAGYESIVLGGKEINDVSVIAADCSSEEVASVHSAWNDNFYNVLFLGDMSDFEEYLDAPEDMSRGSFYSPCIVHNYSNDEPHNDNSIKRVCSECGDIVYTLHVWDNYVNNNDGTHTKTCEKCGREAVSSHELVDPTEINNFKHSMSCECGYVEELSHIYVDGICACGNVQVIPKGLTEIDGVWYYYVDGEKATGWQKIDGEWYYFAKADGAGLDGEKTVGGKVYTFEGGKVTVKAIARTLFEYIIYDGPNYTVAGTEWVGNVYFENGLPIADGYQMVDGVWYLFEDGAKADEAVADGFYTDRNGYGYAENGMLVSDGLRTIDGETYYFVGGYVYAGHGVTSQIIDGKTYLIGNDGKLLNGEFNGILYINSVKAKEGLHKIGEDYYIVNW